MFVATLAAIAGCGGGGGNGPVVTPTAKPTGTPAPTPSPTANPQRPVSSGTFSLSGTYAQTDVYIYPFSTTTPPATPEPTLPPTSKSATVSQAVTVTAGLDKSATVSVVEKDASALETTTQTNVSDVAQVANASGGFNFVEYQSTLTDELNNSIQTTYTAPYILDILPETAGQKWTNSPAATIKETDADGTTSTRTYAANGTYTDNQTFFYGPATIVENADGSGSYSSPVFITNIFYGLGLITYSAPNSSGNVTIELQSIPVPTPTPAPSPSPGQPTPAPTTAPAPTPAPEFVTLPTFYATPLKLYTETDADNGSVAIPTACNVPTSIATKGNQIVQSIVRTDTILGYIDTQTTTSYVVPSFGAACVQFSDLQKIYYDYQNDTTFNFYFRSAPEQTTTITETVGLQTASAASTARSAASASRAAAPLSPGTVVAARTLFLHAIDYEREKRVKAMAAMFRSHRVMLKGVAR